MKIGLTVSLVFGLLIQCLCAQQSNPRLDALKKYILEKDYPEVFADSPYKTRIEGFLDVDIDNDGVKEIVVLFYPHYRQSAPILIYRVNSDLKVERVPEGLAPGPLQKVSGEYLDAHTAGLAVDFEIKPDHATPESVYGIARKSGFNGFVLYDNFFYMDGRKGLPALIDMRGVKVPSNQHDCGSFEFSRIRQIAAGGLREDPSKNYLAAWVGDEIYVYLIRGVSKEGFLDKKLWIVKAPVGFKGFETNQGLTYKTDAGLAVLTLK
jgi:hypothetical protein